MHSQGCVLTCYLHDTPQDGGSTPEVGQTPGEIIDVVLIALREKRSDDDTTGVETLMRFAGPGSSLHESAGVVPAHLLSYFETSK